MSAAEQYATQIVSQGTGAGPLRFPAGAWLTSRHSRRAIVAAGFLAGVVVGFSVTGTHEAAYAATAAGPDLTRLLRGMAMIKSMMALAAACAVLWRLAAPARIGKLAAYVAACAAMAAGPGLIWDMVHVGLGALLLHGGLACAVLLLWRDPATAVLLAGAVRKKGLLF
jgi:hypothetical protein